MIVLPYYEDVPVYQGGKNYESYDLFCLFTHLQVWLSQQNPEWIIRIGTWASSEQNYLTIELGFLSDDEEEMIQNKVNEIIAHSHGYCYLLKARDWWERDIIPRLKWEHDGEEDMRWDDRTHVLSVKHTGTDYKIKHAKLALYIRDTLQTLRQKGALALDSERDADFIKRYGLHPFQPGIYLPEWSHPFLSPAEVMMALRWNLEVPIKITGGYAIYHQLGRGVKISQGCIWIKPRNMEEIIAWADRVMEATYQPAGPFVNGTLVTKPPVDKTSIYHQTLDPQRPYCVTEVVV